MDSNRFDLLTRSFSRRVGLGLGAALGFGLVAAGTETEAKGKKGKKQCGRPCGACAKCVNGKCKAKSVGATCPGGVCQQGRCKTCTDGVKNGRETDIDCGGPDCPPCGVGRICQHNTDCTTARCGDALGTGNTCRTCNGDGVCGQDQNGGCMCNQDSGACLTNFTPSNFANECPPCPSGSICVAFFEGFACVPLCNG